MEKNGKETAVRMLCDMQTMLRKSGIDRLPQRKDFSDSEIMYIKAHLGAFPRALEAAGLKPRDPAHAQKQQEKRIRTKRNRTAAKIRRQNAGSIPSAIPEGEEES